MSTPNVNFPMPVSLSLIVARTTSDVLQLIAVEEPPGGDVVVSSGFVMAGSALKVPAYVMRQQKRIQLFISDSVSEISPTPTPLYTSFFPQFASSVTSFKLLGDENHVTFCAISTCVFGVVTNAQSYLL
ncbi:hypothetical protein BaRGS_00005180 [Batillaria attramentaria]|uniref:Uncharacterized protein n=1 Tax=Batillaria attramentaria TaxID=370345 RepID=A0ABD0LX08_9CAEN